MYATKSPIEIPHIIPIRSPFIIFEFVFKLYIKSLFSLVLRVLIAENHGVNDQIGHFKLLKTAIFET